MALKVISKETIKPSSPTPPHLRNFKVCLFDQVMASNYIPLVLFYPTNLDPGESTSQIISRLKNSLAKTLTRFYPLAGQTKDGMTIDCNDSGVIFIVAHMDCHLNDILKRPSIDSLCDFVPFKPNCFQDTTQGLVGVQVTTLDSGGMVVGVCMHHRIGDTTSMTNFVKSWAKESHMPRRTLENPDFTTARELFPPIDSVKEVQKICEEFDFRATPLVQRRYVFSKSALTSLQSQSANDATPNPTIDIALTSFIWKHMTRASRSIKGSPFTTVGSIIVNMRKLFKPPLSNNCFGSLLWGGSSFLSSDDESISKISQLSHELNLKLSLLDSDFVAKLQKPGVLSEMIHGAIGTSAEEVKIVKVSNWCNMGHYGIDFGWGVPVWVAFAHKTDMLNNLCNIFMDTPSQTGIEVYLTDTEDVLALVESDPEFLEFASINPSVIPY